EGAVLGGGGHATFVQEGGVAEIQGELVLARSSQASASFELVDGSLMVGSFILSREGQSNVVQSGGTLEVAGTMYFSQLPRGNATYELSGGTLQAHEIRLGGSGTEKLLHRGGAIVADIFSVTDNAVYE